MSTRGAESTRSGQTRGLSAAAETSIDNLWMLLFDEGADPAITSDDELVSVEQIGSEAITPTADPNEYGVRLNLPSGSHRVVMLANAADLNLGTPPYTTNPVGEVLVGNLYWAKTDAIGNNKFAASEMAYNNVQFNWHEATTGVIGATSGGISGTNVQGICPSGWRLPTYTEYIALCNATTWTWKSSAPTGYTVSGGSGGSLFFAASGLSGGGSNQGSFGGYWSSVERIALDAHYLNFDSSHVRPAYYDYKTYVFSVRCVQDAPETRATTRAGEDMVGQTYDQVKAELVGHLSYKMYEDGGAIPMWGESGMITTGADEDIHIDLHRAIARIDVEVADGVPFEMTQVVVARPNDKYSVIPAAENLDADGVPNAPSIPGATTPDTDDDAAAFSIEDSKALFAYTGSTFLREIYVPEALIGSVAFGDRMAVVIGGVYTGEDPANETVTWYRIDFKDANGGAGLIDAIVRNHLYTFTVSAVSGPGSEDVETAYQSEIHNMTVSVVDWDEVHFAPVL